MSLMTRAGLRNWLRMLNRMERAGSRILHASRPLTLAVTLTDSSRRFGAARDYPPTVPVIGSGGPDDSRRR